MSNKMQSHNIFLTVVVPVANANGNLRNILSILEIGSHFPIQFVIVQDIFAEDICTTLESLPARMHNCRIDFRTIKAGNPGETRNIGIHIAQGKWICFWDADDKPDIAKFIEMVEKADYGNYDVTIGSFESADSSSELVVSKNVLSEELDYRQIAESPGIWRMAFLRKSIPDIVFSKLRMGEDQLFILDCKLQLKRVMLSKPVVYRYFINNPLQLTRDELTKQEIIKCFRATLFRLNQQDNNDERFILELLFRQALTTIKSNGYTREVAQEMNAFIRVISIGRLRPMILIAIRVISKKFFRKGHFWNKTQDSYRV